MGIGSVCSRGNQEGGKFVRKLHTDRVSPRFPRSPWGRLIGRSWTLSGNGSIVAGAISEAVLVFCFEMRGHFFLTA